MIVALRDLWNIVFIIFGVIIILILIGYTVYRRATCTCRKKLSPKVMYQVGASEADDENDVCSANDIKVDFTVLQLTDQIRRQSRMEAREPVPLTSMLYHQTYLRTQLKENAKLKLPKGKKPTNQRKEPSKNVAVTKLSGETLISSNTGNIESNASPATGANNSNQTADVFFNRKINVIACSSEPLYYSLNNYGLHQTMGLYSSSSHDSSRSIGGYYMPTSAEDIAPIG
ncbi:hypothetical protein EB796_001072 [Bugula neritina]|uniref:Uncharacterized protein n=1 Tax=Bugula neritina TaxID=10212 RepID=A0A7J7KR91_BUGNE|nr:hypothetical protein EB796_001072 [Bugula neritina]